jgi:polyferredoxin
MPTIEELKSEIEQIKERNRRVEADKKWETSWTRKILILILTYIVIVIFFLVAKLDKPFISPIVPTLGFFLSTLTVPFVKKRWLNRNS